jgi:hypothetical protein
VLVYNGIASVVLPVAFVLAAWLARSHGFVSVAWAWAAGYPVAFAALLAMTLPRAGLTAAAYARALIGIVACTAIGLVIGLIVRAGCPAIPAVRAPLVALAILGGYALALSRIEGITLAGVVRALRAGAGDPQQGGAEQQGREQARDLAEHGGQPERADPEVL